MQLVFAFSLCCIASVCVLLVQWSIDPDHTCIGLFAPFVVGIWVLGDDGRQTGCGLAGIVSAKPLL